MVQGLRRWANDAQSNDHLHSSIHMHIKFNQLVARHDDDEASGWIGGRRNEYARARDARAGTDIRQILDGEKPYAPHAGVRIRPDPYLAKGVVLREDAFGETLHTAVDRAHERDSLQQLLPQLNEMAPDEVRDEKPGDEHDEKGKERPKTRQRKAEERLGPIGCGHEEQRLIGELREKANHPDDRQDRQPHEDAGNEVAPQTARARGRCHRCFRGADLLFGRDFVAGAFAALPLRCTLRRDTDESFVSPALFSALFVSEAFASGALASAALSAAFASVPFASSFFSAGSSFSFSARLRLPSLSDLKSVSYQPAPFRRNTGAETSFFSVFLPHDGHFLSGASLNFCMISV